MELIVISESKLKVMLSEDDMREYELDDMSSRSTKEAFRSLMREARARCGFNGLEGRVFVQLYRSRTGGCELFVTKLSKSDYGSDTGSGSDCGSDHGVDAGIGEECRRGGHPRTADASAYSRYYGDPSVGGRRVIYRFDEMQNLLSICGVLLASRYSGTGTAYAEPARNAFYLLLDQETYAAGEHFGKLCPSSFYYYINEHCQMLTPTAVPTLGKLA